MLFDVVFLRRAGHRRLRAEIQADLPLRGDVAVRAGGIHGRIATLERLDIPGRSCRTMTGCTIGPLVGNNLLIAGVEEVKDPNGYPLRQRQAWWCRLPEDEDPRPYCANPPSAVRHDPSYAWHALAGMPFMRCAPPWHMRHGAPAGQLKGRRLATWSAAGRG